MLNIGHSNKDMLAKLLAMENITVLHKKVPTAYFDIKSRTLVCPILKDNMSDELYDLFMGHEVGHALNTPMQGWHSSVSKNGPIFKGYLNVIEDCRIEKLIKDKYPGLRRSFYTGYNELAYDDFFGIKGKDLTGLNLIDRINIHFKIGAQARVKFTEEEKPFIIRANNLKNFKEVMILATELFELQKAKTEEELKSMTQDQLEELMFEFDIDDTAEEGEASEIMTIEVEGEGGLNPESPFIPEEGKTNEGEDSSSQDPAIEERTKESQDGGEEDGNSPSDGASQSPEEELADALNKSDTDEEFRNNEGKLHKEMNQYDRAPIYHELTNKIKYDNFTVKWKEIDKLVTYGGRHDRPLRRTNIAKYVKEFIDNNKKIVNYMVKEFEMKKAAADYKRSSTSKTGELNMDKLHLYKLKDDIFNRIQVTPDGKNHGVVMIIDWSGSMSGSVKATIEQAALLSMFCRRIQIPFRLFAFCDHLFGKNREMFKNNENWKRDRIYGKPNPMIDPKGRSDIDWDLGQLSLLEIFNEKMNNVEFTRNMENWFQIAHSIDHYYDDYKTRSNYDQSWRCPYELNLGGTPLDASIVVMRDYLIDFKRNYGLDILSFIALTDGESHGCFPGWDSSLVDRRNNKVVALTDPDRYSGRKTHKLLEWLKDTTGCRTIGFFLTKCGPQAFYRDLDNFCGAKLNGYDEYSDKKRKEFNKLSASFTEGCYDLAIMINQRKIEIDYKKDQLNVEIGATKGKLKSALVKAGSNKMKQRVILNQFVEQMAV